MPRKGWSGDKVTRAIRYVVLRDGGICWLCGHAGANSCDHVLPASTHPELQWVRSNWRAAHLHGAGHASGKGCPVAGCMCPGNCGRKAKPWPPPGRVTVDDPPSREW